MWNTAIEIAAAIPGTYYHTFPTYAQGKKTIWDGQDNEGRFFRDYVPKDIIDGKPKEDDMQFKLKVDTAGDHLKWSILQVVGVDKINNIVGPNPRGLFMDEYALQNPMGWEYMAPIILQNHGFAYFILTPRGHNHAYDLYQAAIREVKEHGNQRWYIEKLTIDDTFTGFDDKGQPIPIISKEDIEEELRRGAPREHIQQEYYCSFEAGMVGSYYGSLIEEIHAKGRIGRFEWIPKFPVHTIWDIGIGDSTSIIYMQKIQGRNRIIDYLEDTGFGVSHYIKACQDKSYVYGKHIGPHDLENRQFSTGETIWETARGLGITFEVCTKYHVQDGIDAARRFMLNCEFNEDTTKQLLKGLKHYHRKYDDVRKEYLNKPYHDWSSHPSDAFRYMAVSDRSLESPMVVNNGQPIYADGKFDPLEDSYLEN